MGRLHKEKSAFLVIDVQERLFPHIENGCEALEKMVLAVQGFRCLKIPVLFSEQYPEGLGPTVKPLNRLMTQPPFTKTSFSCVKESTILEELEKLKVTDVILSGIEAHVCVWQTASDLLAMGKNVVVLNDATGSRSIYDYSTAIAEMRDAGARISSVETVLFELVGDSKSPEFKTISELVKCIGGDSSRCCCA